MAGSAEVSFASPGLSVWPSAAFPSSSVSSFEDESYPLTSVNGSFRLYSGTSAIAYISPVLGFMVMAHTLFAFFSSRTLYAACVTYLCIFISSVVTRSFPGTGSVLVSG